ncbi:MAG: UDP-4-amino-4,6-dideoxy-N-acetyl-beta-L-altrosamine transaminase [Rhodospirillales bacterium]
MSRPVIGYGRQTIGETDIAAVVEVLKGDYLTQGPAVERFEAALAEKVGARHAVTCTNGTAALHLACLAAGLGPGDTALVPDMTFVATANAPLYCGAESRLTDIDPETRAIAPDSAARFARSDAGAKAILPVHFAGLATAIADIRASAPDLIIIEDACHALGGTYEDGGPVGNCIHSDMTAFSFHPVKPITTGEGGAVTTNDDTLAYRLRLYRNHGIERDADKLTGESMGPWLYEQQALGFNYRMTDLQAALGLAQLAQLDSFLARRREIAAFYDDRLAGLNHATLPHAHPEQRRRSGLHLYHIDIDFHTLGRSRADLMSDLRDAGIGTQVHYIPIHHHPYHRDRGVVGGGGFPVTEDHYRRTLTVPLFPTMTDGEVEYIATELGKRLN